MDTASKLELLLNIIRELGVEVRSVTMDGEGGGLCMMKDRRVLFVDTLADTVTKYERTLEAAGELGELEDRFLPPEVREDIERFRA